MILEGEVDFTLIFALLAGLFAVTTAVAVWFALRHRVEQVVTADDRDMAQKVAEATDRRLFQTLSAIPVALVETDKQGKFVFANRAAHQLLGRKDAELLGLRFHSATWGITFPDGRPVPPDMLPSARALRGQTVRGFQHILANPATRRKMLVSVTAMPIEDEFGEIIGSTAAIVETEGLTTPAPFPVEAAPAPAEEGLTRRVFDAATSALVLVSPNGVVRDANRAARTLAGGRVLDGADFADSLLPEDRRTEGRQALRAAMAAPAPTAEEGLEVLRIPAGGGAETVWRILPLPREDDAAADVILLAGDIVRPEAAPDPTEAERAAAAAEAEHRAALAAAAAERDAALGRIAEAEAKAEQARNEARVESEAARRLETVGRLTGGMAHDFGALLSVMTGALDMILRQADDPERVRRLGQAALTAGRRGETMTQRLSAFSQDEATPAHALDAAVLLRAMEGSLRDLAGPGVDLMIETPPQGLPVRLDPVGFEGAVRALAANAIEAVNGQGSVAIRLEDWGADALLTVRDTGPSMDEGVRARAGEAFFTTKAGHAGLGLTQAQAFARQSGGRLTLSGEPGQGAVATVLLPKAD